MRVVSFAIADSSLEAGTALRLESTMITSDYSARDAAGSVVFYVLLWKRGGVALDLFDDYWRNVHGPVCARLPGQFQYWQLHVAHSGRGLWPEVPGIRYDCARSEEHKSELQS